MQFAAVWLHTWSDSKWRKAGDRNKLYYYNLSEHKQCLHKTNFALDCVNAELLHRISCIIIIRSSHRAIVLTRCWHLTASSSNPIESKCRHDKELMSFPACSIHRCCQHMHTANRKVSQQCSSCIYYQHWRNPRRITGFSFHIVIGMAISLADYTTPIIAPSSDLIVKPSTLS